MAAAHVPLFLYPFLNTTSKTRPFEYLRLTSLGVIGALVKVSPVRLLPSAVPSALSAHEAYACVLVPPRVADRHKWEQKVALLVAVKIEFRKLSGCGRRWTTRRS